VNLDWENLPLGALLEDRYQLPVRVLNDSQAAAMGEFTYGQAANTENNLAVVNVRHGIGVGIIINGRLFEGDGGGAGEIGHTVVVHQDGKLCRCGHYGCLETVASARELLRQVRKLAGRGEVALPAFSAGSAPQDITFEMVCQAFEAGEPTVVNLVQSTGYYMGLGLASMVGILNIRHIVLSGDMTCFGEAWLQTIQTTLNQSALSRLVNETNLEVGGLGKDSILLGASAILANNHALLYTQNKG
jgi:predicted NBD/HSP70 family sugar kinase